MSEPTINPFAAIICGYEISEVQIGRHYLEKHSAYMCDELILNLVSELDRKYFSPQSQSKGLFYYAADVTLKDKWYRLVWFFKGWNNEVLCIVNAYRIKKAKYEK